MEKTVNYKRISIFYMVGSIFNKGIAFLTVPIFTRILSTADYGIVTTYNSWIGILSMVLGFALHMGVRAAFVDYKEKVEDVLSTVIAFTTLFGTVMCIGVYAFLALVFPDVNRLLVLLCMMEGIAHAIIEDFSMYLMMKYRYISRVALMILPNMAAVLVSIPIILFVLKSELYLGRIVPTAIIMILVAIGIAVGIFIKGKKKFSKEYISYCLKISAPLIIHGIALNVLSQSDRTMITWLQGESQTGIYSLVYNFSMVATVLTTAMEGIWVPWFVNRMEMKEYEDINLVSKDYIHFMTYAMIGICFIAPEILKLMAPEEYWEGIQIIPPIVFSNYIIFLYTLHVNVEHFYKKTVGISINTIIAAITNVVLNFLLIPKFGYTAAAYTTLIAYLLSLILHIWQSKRLCNKVFRLRDLIEPTAYILAAIVIFYVFMDNAIMRWGVLIVYILAMFYRERHRLQVYIKSR